MKSHNHYRSNPQKLMEKWIRTNFLLMFKGKLYICIYACINTANKKNKRQGIFFKIIFALNCSSKLISGLLSAKCDTERKEKIDKDIKKVDVDDMEIRSAKHSTKNSKRSVLSVRRSINKASKSFNRSTSVHKMLTRSQSISMMVIENESSCSTRRSLN